MRKERPCASAFHSNISHIKCRREQLIFKLKFHVRSISAQLEFPSKTIDSVLLNIIWLWTLHTIQMSCLAYFEIHKHFKIDNKKATWFSKFARDLNKLWMNLLQRRIATNSKSKLITDNKLCIWLAQRCQVFELKPDFCWVVTCQWAKRTILPKKK